ncbi:MAG: ADP-ribosylglycohydrolase family protein [Firmicutes bacterium]|nr:ADP-ribosylglycohydrolase family protein [Bacillota bacterium]
MLKEQPWFTLAEGLSIEVQQSRDEGKEVEGFAEKVKAIQAMDPDDPEREARAAEVYDELQKLPVRDGYSYIEPSELEAIKKARPYHDLSMKPNAEGLKDDVLLDKVYGAWLGRCAGCLLGQPIEGWRRERIVGLLQETGNYPFKYYISSDVSEEIRRKYGLLDHRKNWINNVQCMPEDDDLNYTVIGLKLLEEYGPNFTPDDVAECWLANLPILHLCTAERVAYKNFVNRVFPPVSAYFRNPYREWIGAQIRADFFGYIAPGRPEVAAEMAWRDASISHVKNGIYGEMFVAAMLSAAAVTDDVEEIIHCGLSQIPEKSRLSEAIKSVLEFKKNGLSWEQAIDEVHKKYDEKNSHDWCHVIPNAMIVCIGLLYGGLDFEKSIGTAVLGAFDTDCNGATVGSIVGMVLGAKALPEKWIKPLNNRLKSGVNGFGLVEISELARRTAFMARKILAGVSH